MKGYNTNLASEFYVLSMLYRKGFDAYITLGNKKTVDIVVDSFSGKRITIDVKGIKGKTMFPVDNLKDEKIEESLFIVFVTYLNQIGNHEIQPEVFIVPSVRIDELLYVNPKKTRRGVNYSTLKKFRKEFQDSWHLLYGFLNTNISYTKAPEQLDSWCSFIKAYSELRAGFIKANDIEHQGIDVKTFITFQQSNVNEFSLEEEKFISQYCKYKSIDELFSLRTSLQEFKSFKMNIQEEIHKRESNGNFQSKLDQLKMTEPIAKGLIEHVKNREKLRREEKKDRRERFKQ